MNLIQTKEHIIRVSGGYPNAMNQAALQVIDEKIKDKFICDWAKNDKDELIKTLEFIKACGGVSKLNDKINLLKKKAITLKSLKSKRIVYEKELLTLLIKIDLL